MIAKEIKGGFMNKVAVYLNEHLTGEVLTHGAAVAAAECDGSVLTKKPEMVIRPSGVNDVRKVMRFCSQLAEKGYRLPVVVRGCGTDHTGGALSSGIVLDMSAYMHHVLGIDPKQQLIHVQAGISQSAVQATLTTHKGMGIADGSLTGEEGTIGGALSSLAVGATSGMYGTIGDAVQQLEVVLSSGDVIQTGRISRRELNKKKGLSTFEGELYRQIDNIIEDNRELIDQLDADASDTAGYPSIARVKRRDGSFDLTPLLIGSQGSLGIVSEIILKAGFAHPELAIVTAAYDDYEKAQSASEVAQKAGAALVEFVDGRIMARVAAAGKTLEWAPEAAHSGGVMIAVCNAFSDRSRERTAKKLVKKLTATGAIAVHHMNKEAIEFAPFHSFMRLAAHPSDAYMFVPHALSGIAVPAARLGSFLAELRTLEVRHEMPLPVFVDMMTGAVNIYPLLSIKKVSHRQKLLQLCADVARLAHEHEGSLAGFGGEGRLKAAFTQPLLSEEERSLYTAIKHVFDPNNLLNPDSKSAVSVKTLAAEFNAWCRVRQ